MEADSSFVYAIWASESDLVKIGYSTDPNRRLENIQTTIPSAERLMMLWCRPGDQALEFALHQEFAGRRRHGEWFDFRDVDALYEIDAVYSRMTQQTSIHEMIDLQERDMNDERALVIMGTTDRRVLAEPWQGTLTFEQKLYPWEEEE